jgi:hypothetical protein
MGVLVVGVVAGAEGATRTRVAFTDVPCRLPITTTVSPTEKLAARAGAFLVPNWVPGAMVTVSTLPRGVVMVQLVGVRAVNVPLNLGTLCSVAGAVVEGAGTVVGAVVPAKDNGAVDPPLETRAMLKPTPATATTQAVAMMDRRWVRAKTFMGSRVGERCEGCVSNRCALDELIHPLSWLPPVAARGWAFP